MPEPIERLRTVGQSVWLDFIRRAFIDSGELERYIDARWITGLTSNPTIFAKAISGSTDYQSELRDIAWSGEHDAYAAFVRLASTDIRRAADAFRPIFDASGGLDGYVSFETPPGVEHDVEATVAEAKRLFALVGRPNVLIKVPGTAAGIEALTCLIADGVNVNVTLLFAVGTYERVAEAYLVGLERRLERGGDLSRLASVASFFVSRLDTAVDRELSDGSPLRGTAAVANAQAAYHRFRKIFAGPRWDRLAGAGARVQRPLWASTGTKNTRYSDVLYVDALIVPDTVNTMPEATLRAFADHGVGRRGVPEDPSEARHALHALAAAGIELETVTQRLLQEGLAAFAADFARLLRCISDAMAAALHVSTTASSLGPLANAVDERLARFAREDVTHRLWSGDHTLWTDHDTEISDRLGWLAVVGAMEHEAEDLHTFAASVAADGITSVVLLGMGGSSLAPEVLGATFSATEHGLSLEVLDTTDPASIRALEERIDLDRTLFIAASKSGSTVETLSQLAYFAQQVTDPGRFVVITDPGSPLATLGTERGFRRVFLNPPDIGGRYSALSYFGLVPAALVGVDLLQLLDRAREMAQACHACVPPADNPGAWLGAVLGEAALAGRDKLTLIVPDEITTFGTWVEQLIAESTGKDGRGIVPVEGEAIGSPEAYGDDRLFVAIGEHGALEALEAAGHPVVRLPYVDRYQLGGEIFRWAFATAVAGHVLGIHPFDQPNVQEAKDATARVLDGAGVDAATPSAGAVLGTVTPGDYIAILAYVPRSPEWDARLQRVRLRLRGRHRVATTIGYGPRFLHSTGQLHKGGPDTGIFIQIVPDDGEDLSIPGRPYGFGELRRAQALGDLQALRAHGRRVARATVDELEELIT